MSVQPFPRVRATLRIKFLLALTVISALLTSAVLLIVQYRVRVHAREEIAQSLGNSMVAFQSLQQQRGATLERTVELLATLPPLRAAMTSEDPATIQDASKPFWEMAGSQVFALADRTGRLVAFHTTAANFDRGTADASLRHALGAGQSSDWWFGGGHLFEVFVEPIYFGAPDPNHVLGMLAVGYEIDSGVAADVTRAAASEIAFGYDGQVIISTVPEARRGALAEYLQHDGPTPGVREVRLGDERFLAESVRLSGDRGPVVTVVFLKSFDEATAFLRNLNRWIA